jgi:hypothetical protein
MNILAAGGGSQQIISTVQSAPLSLVYLVVVALFVLVAIRMGSTMWHFVVAALLLGLFANVAVPQVTVKLTSLATPTHRVLDDAVLLVLLIAVVILTVMKKRRG